MNQAAAAELLDEQYDERVAEVRERNGIAARPVVVSYVCPRCSGEHPKSDCHTVRLDALMGRVLLELSMLGQADSQKIDGAQGYHQHPDSRPPPGFGTGFSNTEMDQFRARYDKAQTDDEREQVIAYAQAELESIKKRQAPIDAETHDDLETLILDDGRGFNPEEVARRFCTTARLVRNLRAKHNRDPLTGQPTGGGGLSVPERRKEVARMMADGCGVRAMAQILDVSIFTISTDRRAVLAEK